VAFLGDSGLAFPLAKGSLYDPGLPVRKEMSGRSFLRLLRVQQVYAPVDSANDPSWREIVAAHEAGTLAPVFACAHFTQPRPVIELFDLEKDPAELNNLAGQPEYAAVERELKIALQEKMILDYDFLPLPLNE
jgi:hypothetical protein